MRKDKEFLKRDEIDDAWNEYVEFKKIRELSQVLEIPIWFNGYFIGGR